MSVEQGNYGPVAVKEKDGSTRIGYYDDDDVSPNGKYRAVVHYSEPPFLFGVGCRYVKYSAMAPIDTDVLWRRRQTLQHQIAMHHIGSSRKHKPADFRSSYLLAIELMYVSGLLSDRMFEARSNEGAAGGKRIFISHSSKDKQLAVWLATDLANEGQLPWLDEWKIRAGESIPLKVSSGIEDCDYMLVLLSEHSVKSGWVEAEWSARYWTDIEENQVTVIPVLISDCKLPTLLRTKKYADLREDYREGLMNILEAVR